MTAGLGRARSAVVLLLLAAPLALVACAGTGYHYVKSSENKTYFKVPDSWKLYDQDSVLDALKGALSKDEIDQRRDTMWTTVFDASPDPSLNHLASNRPNYPLGQAVVRPLSPDASDAASLQSLRNIFFSVDDALQAGNAHVSAYEPRRARRWFPRLPPGCTGRREDGLDHLQSDRALRPGNSKVYAISIYCTTECYDKYESKIDSVIKSWTVKDK